MNILEIENVSFVRNNNYILRNVNWQIKETENWIILGPNGSGKSSLISLITGYQWPTTGSVKFKDNRFGNCEIQKIRKIIGLFNPAISDQILLHHPSITALEVICTGEYSTIGVYNEFSDDLKNKARSLINNTFISSGFNIDEDRQFNILSSGEKRKILFLRMLMTKPELIIFDEPYESLDIPSRAMLEKIFSSFFDLTKIPNITILHRIEEIPVYANKALILKNGKIFTCGDIDTVINSENLSELFEIDITIEKHSNRYVCILNNS